MYIIHIFTIHGIGALDIIPYHVAISLSLFLVYGRVQGRAKLPNFALAKLVKTNSPVHSSA